MGFKMSIELRVAEKNEGKSWDRIVEASTYGTIFHTWKWLKIMEKHTKSKLYPIIGLKGSTIIGIYPLFYLKNFFFKSVFSPPPWVSVPFLGPVMVVYDKLKQDKKETLFREFQNKVDELVKSELKPSYTFISSSPGLLDVRPFKWSGYHVEPAYTYLLDLSNGETRVWEHFKKNLRNDISRTREREVFVEEGSKEDLAWISKALAERYKNVITRSQEDTIDSIRFLDVRNIFATILGLINNYVKYLNEKKYGDKLEFKLKLRNCYRTTLYIDSEDFFEHVENFGIPICGKEEQYFPKHQISMNFQDIISHPITKAAELFVNVANALGVPLYVALSIIKEMDENPQQPSSC